MLITHSIIACTVGSAALVFLHYHGQLPRNQIGFISPDDPLPRMVLVLLVTLAEYVSCSG